MMMSLAELRARVAHSPPRSATSDRKCPTEGLGSAGTSSRMCAMALSLAGSISLSNTRHTVKQYHLGGCQE